MSSYIIAKFIFNKCKSLLCQRNKFTYSINIRSYSRSRHFIKLKYIFVLNVLMGEQKSFFFSRVSLLLVENKHLAVVTYCLIYDQSWEARHHFFYREFAFDVIRFVSQQPSICNNHFYSTAKILQTYYVICLSLLSSVCIHNWFLYDNFNFN